jgi:hypothetical protein
LFVKLFFKKNYFFFSVDIVKQFIMFVSMNKAILLDPFANTISHVNVGDFHDIQKHIGCDMFTTVRFDERNTAFCDDEGLLNGTDRCVRFVDEVYPQALAGRVLILGDGDCGESADCTHTLDYVKSKVKHFCELFYE